MFVIIITALTILFVSLARDGTYSTNAKDLVRNDNVNDKLTEILHRMDQIERNINIRFDKVENHVDRLQRQMDQMETKTKIGINQLENDNRNQTVLMETIVEQQMVITAEIFTVSQTLPFCCCQYQSTTDPVLSETTTPKPMKSLPTNCAEAMGDSGRDGTYQINITNSNIGPFDVYCMTKVTKLIEEDIINGKWLIIQRRLDNTTDFYRNWNMYQHGFGDLKGNFWIGLDKLYALTKSTQQELWVQLEDRDSIKAWAKYSNFAIGNEDELYELKTVGRYDGTAGDSLRNNTGCKWSTFDNDNDKDPDLSYNCAVGRKGAWWFFDCGASSLNGVYGGTGWTQGILWDHFRGLYHSMKYAHMAIRPRM